MWVKFQKQCMAKIDKKMSKPNHEFLMKSQQAILLKQSTREITSQRDIFIKETRSQKRRKMYQRSATNFIIEDSTTIGKKQKQQQLDVFKETIKLDDQTQHQLQQIKEVEIGSSNEVSLYEHAQLA